MTRLCYLLTALGFITFLASLALAYASAQNRIVRRRDQDVGDVGDVLKRLDRLERLMRDQVAYKWTLDHTYNLDTIKTQDLVDSKRQATFENIYRSNAWSNNESRSGPGSTLEATAGSRQFLSRFVKEYKIKTFLDAPCGDFSWQRHRHRTTTD